jgi:hypothetical protein
MNGERTWRRTFRNVVPSARLSLAIRAAASARPPYLEGIELARPFESKEVVCRVPQWNNRRSRVTPEQVEIAIIRSPQAGVDYSSLMSKTSLTLYGYLHFRANNCSKLTFRN